jgi:transcriptional regulator with XRE-family HTH domain
MGYRGKIDEQNRARDLRTEGWTMPEIAEELGVSRSSVSLWTRDVPYTPRRPPRSGYDARTRTPNTLQRRKAEQIEELLAEGRERIGQLSEREFLISGAMLYAGEGTKTDGAVGLANSDPRMHAFFCAWLRHFFAIDESRLRVWMYLHEGLDLDAAERFWSDLLDIPRTQFGKAYRAVPDASIRRSKHPMGCPKVAYSCVKTHRAVMGLVTALLASDVRSGVAQSAAQRIVNPKVLGSSPSPGANR